MSRKKPPARGYLSLLAEPVQAREPVLTVRHGAPGRVGWEPLALPIVEDSVQETKMVPATLRRAPAAPAPVAPLAVTRPPIAQLPATQAPVVPAPATPEAIRIEKPAEDRAPMAQPPRQPTAPEEKVSDPASVRSEFHTDLPVRPSEAPDDRRDSKTVQAPEPRPQLASESAATHGERKASGQEAREGPAADGGRPADRPQPLVEELRQVVLKPGDSQEKVTALQALAADDKARERPHEAAHDNLGEASAVHRTKVRIGTVEIRTVIAKREVPQTTIAPIPVPQRGAERHTPVGGAEPLSRGLSWRFGLVQG